MNRLLRHSARWLFSAGVFTLGGLALTPSAHAGDPPRAIVTTRASTAQTRLEAMKVEIALLGDPITYALPLEIRTHDEDIELHGVVSSEAARQRALDLARRSCYLPVADQMTLAGSVNTETIGIPREARDRLVQQLGAQADGIRLHIHADGRVQLTGQVRTLEDKLLASRSLQSLPRCAALVNELTVTGSTAKQSFTLVTHAAQSIESPATLPSGLPAGLAIVQPAAPDRVKQTRRIVSGYASGSPAPVNVSGVLMPAEHPTGPAVIVPAAPPGKAKGIQVSGQTVEQPQSQVVVWPPAYREGPPPTPMVPLPAGSAYQSRPLENLTRWSVAQPRVNTLIPAAPLVSTPVVQTETITPAVAVEHSLPMAPVEPAKPMKKQRPGSAPPESQLMHKVKAACGKLASDVRVEKAADGFLAVHVFSAPGQEQRVTAKLFTVSELMAPRIRLHVHMAQ